MYPTRYAHARDRRHWQAQVSGLVSDEDGRLSLARIPAVTPPADQPGPWEVETSGLAAAACCSVFIADVANARIVYRDGLCGNDIVLPGPGGHASAPMFVSPRGVACDRSRLAVADAGQGAVLIFDIDTLRLRGSLRQGLVAPTAIAFTSDGSLVVLDAMQSGLQRFSVAGIADAAFAVAAAAAVGDPRAFAPGDDACWHVLDGATRSVVRLDRDGNAVGDPITGSADWRPCTLAVSGPRMFVADAATGRIGVFEAGRWLGDVPGYRGPVSALAVGEDGQLFIKPGADDTVLIACADAASIGQGELVCGPWDAGERDGWERAVVDAVIPASASLRMEACFSDTPSVPGLGDWIAAPSTDVWLTSLLSPSLPTPQAPALRYLWLRVRFRPSAAGASPVLEQVRAATADEDYRQHLPSVYAETDEGTVLQRLLALARGEVADGEVALADLPRTFSPEFLPSEHLPWLAGWLAFALPDGLDVAERRVVLARVQGLYQRRGTLAGLLEFIHLYTGVRARIVEPFMHRRVWQMGFAALGFDTGLPPAAADGMVVSDPEILRDGDPSWGCSPERVVVGHAVVGVDRPVARCDLGSVLFDDEAHRITVLIPAGQAMDSETRRRIRAVVEAEKPAHVLCDICFIEPRLRIGMQSSIGIDSIVAGEGESLRLAESHWNQDAHLGGAAHGAGNGQAARIGSSLVLG